MKFIKLLFLFAINLCTNTLLYGQELKPEVSKPLEIKVTPAADDNKASQVPEFKPQPVVEKETKPASAAETPKATPKDESLKPGANVKAEAKTIDAGAARKKLSTEQLKTFNGNSARPKEQPAMPNTTDKPIRPALPKPAVNKTQQE